MKNYYVAEVNVIVDGKDSFIIKVAGLGYTPNEIKNSAENKVREHNSDKKITSIIINKIDLDIEEYKEAVGANPSWLKPNEDE